MSKLPGLPSRNPPSPLTLVLGIISGGLLAVAVLLTVAWVLRGRRRQAADIEPPAGRVVGSGGLAMSQPSHKRNIKLGSSSLLRLEKEEADANMRQPHPDILSKKSIYKIQLQL